MLVFFRLVKLRDLTCVIETMLSHWLVSIVVVLQLLLSIPGLVTTPCEKLSMWDCIVTMDVECLRLCRRFV